MRITLNGILILFLLATRVRAAEPAALRDAANGKFLIGAAINARLLDQPESAGIIARQFDAITAGNEFKPADLEPRAGEFRFQVADRIAAFAAAHHQAMIGHTLCWHNQTPKWMFASADGKPLPREQGLANLKRHIDTVVGHFRGKVLGWDVVNEAIDDGPGYLRDTPARRSIGDDFIIRAFEFAHAADPAAELYYNDYNIELGKKREKVLRLIGELKAAGARIDAVGVQGHWSLKWPAVAEVEQGIVAIHNAGVAVQITEMDVDVLPRDSKSANITDTENRNLTAELNPYSDGLPEAVAKQQADRYGQLFAVFVKHRQSIKRVTLWGFSDGDSWLNDYPIKGRTNYPMLFDRKLQPKLAFDSVMAELRGKN